MDNRLYFFDIVEQCLADEAYQKCMAFSEDDMLLGLTDYEVDKIIMSKVFGSVQEKVYDFINKKNNIQIHKFFTFSLIQLETHNPSNRINNIKDKLKANLSGGNEQSDLPLDEKELYVINRFLKSYKSKFFDFDIQITKLNDDFKSGLLGNNNFIPPIQETQLPAIKYESFNIFIKQLEYNYPYDISPLGFKYTMKDNLNYLSKEIFSNLVVMDKEAKKPYLNQIKYDIQNNKQYAGINLEDLNIWLKKYNIPSEEWIRFDKENNELYSMLNRMPPDMDEEFEDGFNHDTGSVQNEFYNYYYGFYIDEALKLIDEQLNELNPAPVTDVQAKQTVIPAHPKLNTNLTVPQLSYLFKMLMDIHPPIFTNKTKKEIYQFIEANFTTKGKEETGPTVTKLNNLYSDVDKPSARFWADHLRKMLSDARKV